MLQAEYLHQNTDFPEVVYNFTTRRAFDTDDCLVVAVCHLSTRVCSVPLNLCYVSYRFVLNGTFPQNVQIKCVTFFGNNRCGLTVTFFLTDPSPILVPSRYSGVYTVIEVDMYIMYNGNKVTDSKQ